MKTLQITKITRGTFASAITFCEVDEDGTRDGFEDIEVQHELSTASDADKTDIDNSMKALAAERGMEY